MEDLKIKINPEYAKLVPPLSDKEFIELRESITENGLWHPITVNKDGIILDGHHRFKICNDLQIKIIQPDVVIKEFSNRLYEMDFVITSNTKRRHLNEVQRIELELKREPILKQIVKLNMSSGGKGVPIQTPLGRIDQEIATGANTSRHKVRMVQFLLEKAEPETLKRLREGKSKISKEYFRVQKAIRINDARQTAEKLATSSPNKNSKFNLIFGDMRKKVAKSIPAESIDMIFTDPPYLKESVYLYGELAKLANRVLKPGGSLVFFMGHFHEDEIEDLIKLNGPDLVFNHRFIVQHTGHIKSLTSKRVWAYYKPLMHYYKLKESGKMPTPFHDIADVIVSEAVPKDDHEWEQSTKEAFHMIEPLTVENQIVLDPFMGSGTTGMATLELGRRFTGIEIEKNAFDTAKAKLSKCKWGSKLLESKSKSEAECGSECVSEGTIKLRFKSKPKNEFEDLHGYGLHT